MDKRYIVSLDLATTSGIALYDKVTKEIFVNIIKGNPLEQFEQIRYTIYLFCPATQTEFIIEEHVYFKFVKVARSLMERIGFIMWSLVEDGYTVEKLFPYKARKQMKENYIEFDKDRKDALYLIHERLAYFEPFDNIQVLKINNRKIFESK